MAFRVVIEEAVASKYAAFVSPWTDAAQVVFDAPPTEWTVGKHGPTESLVIIPREVSKTNNLLQKLAMQGVCKVEPMCIFDAERMGLLSFYSKPPEEPALQPDDETDSEPAAPQSEDLADLLPELAPPPVLALIRCSAVSAESWAQMARMSPSVARELVRRSCGLTDVTWGLLAPMFSDELVQYQTEEALCKSKASAFEAFEWKPKPPAQLTVCSNKNMSAERRLAWTLWRAAVAGYSLEKRREDFVKFMTFFRDTSPYPSAKLFTEAVRAWALWGAPALPARREFSAQERLDIKVAEGPAHCPSCNAPVFTKKFGVACSKACQRLLCKRCNQMMEPLAPEECEADPRDLDLRASQTAALHKATLYLHLRPRVEGPPEKHVHCFPFNKRKQLQVGHLRPNGNFWLNPNGCGKQLDYRGPGDCYSAWRNATPQTLSHLCCGGACQLEQGNTCNGQVDCKFCWHDEVFFKTVKGLKENVEKVSWAELERVKVALEGCEGRPLKRRRLFKCAACPAWPPRGKALLETEDGRRYLAEKTRTAPALDTGFYR